MEPTFPQPFPQGESRPIGFSRLGWIMLGAVVVVGLWQSHVITKAFGKALSKR